MKEFARLFETEQYGQILVTLDTNDEAKPQVKFSFIPEHLGVCSTALGFEDTEKGWDEAEKAFQKFDSEEKAISVIKPVIDLMNKDDVVAT